MSIVYRQNAPTWDVCIVGGGLAGLACALTLSREAPTKRVLLLEAAPELGGRIETRRHGGAHYEMGAQWVGPAHTHLLSLLNRFGVLTESQLWPAEVETLESAEAHMDALEKYGSDTMTVADLLHKYGELLGQEAVLDTELMVRSCFACDPDEVSPHFVVRAVRGCGGVAALADGPQGAQSMYVPGGMSSLLRKVGAHLQQRGVTVRTGCPVSLVEQTSHGVTITLPSGTETAAAAVVAMTPPAWKRIVKNMTAPARGLSEGMFMGSCIKTIAVYDAPFWEGLTPPGRLELMGPVACAFPLRLGGKHALIGLICGKAARARKGTDRKALQEEVHNQYLSFYRHTSTMDFFDAKDWSASPYIRGCFSALPKPGVLAALEALNSSSVKQGHLVYACTELSTEWPGYMEGALRSGRRAAMALLEKQGFAS